MNHTMMRGVVAVARCLIERPENWCQGSLAQDGDGEPCSPYDEGAVRWCAEGAICRVVCEARLQPDCVDAVRDYLTPASTTDRLAEINDGQDGHAAVLVLLDQAIARLEDELEVL